jgi:hypothetical protein
MRGAISPASWRIWVLAAILLGALAAVYTLSAPQAQAQSDRLNVTSTRLWGIPANGQYFAPDQSIHVRFTVDGEVHIPDGVGISLEFTDADGTVHTRFAEHNTILSTDTRPVFEYEVQDGDPKADKIVITNGFRRGSAYGANSDGSANTDVIVHFYGDDNLQTWEQETGEVTDPASYGVDGRPKVSAVTVSSVPAVSHVVRQANGYTWTFDDYYRQGEKIYFVMAFDQPVDVTGPVCISIRVGTGPNSGWRGAWYESGTGTHALGFTYTVQTKDYDDNGIGIDSGGGSRDNRYGFCGDGKITSAGTDTEASWGYNGFKNRTGQNVDGRPYVESTEITSEPVSGVTYWTAEKVQFALNYSAPVDVTGTPTIDLEFDYDDRPFGVATHREATYESGSGTKQLIFAYEVKADDKDLDGVTLNVGAGSDGDLGIADGTIKAAGTEIQANYWFTSIADAANHKVDGSLGDRTPPKLESLSITSNPGEDETYAVGDAIEVTVTFSENVSFVAPSSDSATDPEATLELDIGGTAKSATYSSVSGAAMVFSYTVQGGDRDEDGVSIDADMLTVVSGSIEDTDGNAAEVAHQAVPTQAGHKVLGGYIVAENSPAGVAIGPPVGQGSYTLGGTDAASFSINADTGQLLTSAALDYETKNEYSVTVSDGADTTTVAIFVSNVDEPGVVTLSAYTHVVNTPLTATLTDPDGDVSAESWQWQVSWYRPDGWSDIPWGLSKTFTVDNTGTALGRLRVRVTYTDGHGPDKSALSDVSNDQDAPDLYDMEITSNAGSDNTYTVGDDIVVKAIFGEGVAVTGTPQLELNFGGQTRMANFDRVQIDPLSNLLSDVIFIYTVDEDDLSLNGVAIEKNKLDLNGGAIKDFAHNDTEQTYSKLAADSSHKVDGVRPTLLSAVTSADGTRVTITFTEDVKVAPLLDWFISQNNLPGSHLFVLSVLNVEVDEAWPVQTNATVSNDTVTVTMDKPITSGQDVKVRYDGVYANAAPEILMDMAGNPMTLFGATAGTNASPVPADPGARGITMSVRELAITEGEGDSYTIALSAQPTGNVNVTLTSVTPENVTLSANALTFTSTNWNTAQTVTVSSTTDDNDYGYWVTIVHTASGSGYTGQDAIKVLMTEE